MDGGMRRHDAGSGCPQSNRMPLGINRSISRAARYRTAKPIRTEQRTCVRPAGQGPTGDLSGQSHPRWRTAGGMRAEIVPPHVPPSKRSARTLYRESNDRAALFDGRRAYRLLGRGILGIGLRRALFRIPPTHFLGEAETIDDAPDNQIDMPLTEIGRASCRERV